MIATAEPLVLLKDATELPEGVFAVYDVGPRPLSSKRWTGRRFGSPRSTIFERASTGQSASDVPQWKLTATPTTFGR